MPHPLTTLFRAPRRPRPIAPQSIVAAHTGSGPRVCPHRFGAAVDHRCGCSSSCARVAPVEPSKARAQAERKYDVLPDTVRAWLRENERGYRALHGRGE